MQRTKLKMDGGVQGLWKCDTVGEIKILEMDELQVLNLHEAERWLWWKAEGGRCSERSTSWRFLCSGDCT